MVVVMVVARVVAVAALAPAAAAVVVSLVEQWCSASDCVNGAADPFVSLEGELKHGSVHTRRRTLRPLNTNVSACSTLPGDTVVGSFLKPWLDSGPAGNIDSKQDGPLFILPCR